jgi:hypothetical protein
MAKVVFTTNLRRHVDCPTVDAEGQAVLDDQAAQRNYMTITFVQLSGLISYSRPECCLANRYWHREWLCWSTEANIPFPAGEGNPRDLSDACIAVEQSP